MNKIPKLLMQAMNKTLAWSKNNWVGIAVTLFASLIFFMPILGRLGTYSEGGDAMFNAWLMARNHHCILQQGCPDYTTSNMYYPHQDSMLYSETELSAAVLTLPLHFIDKNPIFAYNVWTILSFFFSGLFMYMLARYLSKGNELVSVAAGLIFEFAPIKMASVAHLQNLSIFYMPLIILLLLKYFAKPKTRYLVMLFVALVLQFYASWYQMVFVLIPVAIFIVIFGLNKGKGNLRSAVRLGAVTFGAILATIPLAIEYVQFSKVSNAGFGILDQVKYSSSLNDYIIPYSGAAFGKIYYAINPAAQHNSYNPDSFAYMGLALIVVTLLVVGFTLRKKVLLRNVMHRNLVVALVLVMVAGFLISLGPLLKLDQDSLTYTDKESGLKITFALPYLAVDKFLPQLSFIRATGRASILVLFSACCLLAMLPAVLRTIKTTRLRQRLKIAQIVIVGLIAFEIMPLHVMAMSPHSYNYNLKVPEVYRFIKNDPQINNIIILAADPDYPDATIPVQRAEWILWAGYHNKNIFNGYSGYTPGTYFEDYGGFLDFHEDDVENARKLGLKYVLVDKQLSSKDERLINNTRQYLPDKVYEDNRYVLFKVN